ncbi:MAG: IS1380 family transposase [Magnetococcales bacterium]|nr:IS1380 family transposase [Magnetococcales bacterium]
MSQYPLSGEGFSVVFSDREVTAWGGLALLKRMLDSMGFREAAQKWELPPPGSNRGYPPLQLIEQFIVAIWCGASRFVHAETVRFDHTLTRLFGWDRVAGHKAIVRLFERFDMLTNERVQASVYRWFFDRITTLKRVTLDLDSTVITRHGEQEGAARGYNPGRRGRPSHHPLFAFVAEARMVANFWLRPSNTSSANNTLSFLESTLHNLGDKTVGLLRADSGFFDEKILLTLEEKRIAYIIAARLTRPLQREIYRATGWWALAPGLELTEITYQAQSWQQSRRVVVVRQSVKRKEAQGKMLSLFGDDPDAQGWRYGAFVTSLELPMVEVWRTYRGRADCENRIKELKADFGLEAFNLNEFYATEAALGFAMLAYNLMSLFRQTVMRTKVQHTLSTLHGLVLAIGGSWRKSGEQQLLMLSVPRRKRAWFTGLWANAANLPAFMPVGQTA